MLNILVWTDSDGIYNLLCYIIENTYYNYYSLGSR